MSEEQSEETVVEEEQPLVTGGPEDISGAGESEISEPVEAAPAAPAENIKIGDQSFATQKEAWDYADELAKERLAQDAYRQGIDDASRMQTQVTPENAPVEAGDSFDDEFYSNPQEYLKKYGEQIKKSVTEDLNSASATKTREAELWKQFYDSNPDLQVKERLVKSILQDNWDVLGRMKNSDDALRILADKTRAELKSWSDADKPSTEMPRTAMQAGLPRRLSQKRNLISFPKWFSIKEES